MDFLVLVSVVVSVPALVVFVAAPVRPSVVMNGMVDRCNGLVEDVV